MSGTCYNGIHWLNTEDCFNYKSKEECIKLNAIDNERKVKTSSIVQSVVQLIQSKVLKIKL